MQNLSKIIEKYTKNNRNDLEKYKLCFCYTCFSEFDVSKIKVWESCDGSVECPKCIDCDTILVSPSISKEYSFDDIEQWYKFT